ncbi:hypothetical protein BGY98DRAFT_1096206 [Russula aff. rugulosa BPL654]|nr:hypothetical protein BGY98DRAFT_1096206 [Russula aff. rugulosa BPL654]
MSTQAYWIIMNVVLTINGLYIWEFIITLDYEWRVIRGRLPCRWTTWVYSFARVAALVGAILCIVGIDITKPLHCQLWMSFTAGLIYLSAVAASLLIVLRNIAIWNRNKVVMALSIAVWGIGTAFHINSAAQLRVVWNPALHSCDAVKTKSSILSFIPTIVSDLVLLLIMLVGLLILRCHGGGAIGLSRVLWKQGVIWFALATATEVPPLVLMASNSNDHLNTLFEIPCLITMIVAATRMHRYLIDFASKPHDLEDQNPQVSKLVFARAKQTDTTPTTLNRIEVTVHTAFEQHATPRKSDDCSSDMSTNEHMPHIDGYSSKLDPSEASTHPLPTVSASPQTQSV